MFASGRATFPGAEALVPSIIFPEVNSRLLRLKICTRWIGERQEVWTAERPRGRFQTGTSTSTASEL